MSTSPVILALCLLSFPVFLKGQVTHQEITETFFEKYVTNTNEAFDYLFATNPWMQGNTDGVEQVKFKLREYAKLMGTYLGYEPLGEKSLGSSLKIVICLVKYERQPLRFIFKFYKPQDDWRILNFSFDENVDEVLEEIMKYD